MSNADFGKVTALKEHLMEGKPITQSRSPKPKTGDTRVVVLAETGIPNKSWWSSGTNVQQVTKLPFTLMI